MPQHKSYSDKLRDPRWQKRRLEIFQRDNFTCLVCGCDNQTLHVHHRRYCGNPWESPDEDLETVCEICHDRLNEIPKDSMKMVRDLIDHPIRAADVLAAAELAIERFVEHDCEGDFHAAQEREDLWKVDFLFFVNLKQLT